MSTLPDKWAVPVRLGFSVIPVETNGKKPLGEWKAFMKRPADGETIARWAANDTNVGIVTGRVSGVVVLDFDDERAETEAKRRGLPETVTAKTSRGRHYFFNYPDRPIRKPKGFPSGMDVQSDHKFVVAPGSLHPSGTVYEWENDPDIFSLADLPDWLLEPAETPAPGAVERDPDDDEVIPTPRTIDELRDALGAIGADERELWIRMGMALKADLPEAKAMALWLDWSKKSKKYDPADAERVWESMRPEATSFRAVFAEAMENWNWRNPRRKRPEADRADPASLPIEWGEDIEPRLSALWLIKRTLPQIGLALIFGHPGSGKTFLALDMAGHIAMGRDWNGSPVRKGVVVYVCAEGQNGARNRIAAFRQHHGIAGDFPLALIPCSIDLHNPAADRARLADAVRRAAKHYGEEPVLIIIDTISKTLGGGKENTDDLATYVANCGWLASEFQCCVMPIHHRPKDQESSDPRGHGSLKGGLDTVILVEGGSAKRARITKQRDDEERDLLTFRLKVHQLGRDEDGEPVTSCTVEPVDADAMMPADPLVRAVVRLRDGHRVIYDQLVELLDTEALPVPDEIPSEEIDRSRVHEVVLLDRFRTKAISARGTDAGRKPDSDRRAFDRALEALRKRGIIKVWNDWVWIPCA